MSAPVFAADGSAEGQRVRQLIAGTYDKPDARVRIDPVVVVGDFALAAWTQGDRGGRALLQREHGTWNIVLCAGAAFTRAEALADAGVPAKTARRLAKRLAQAEEKVSAERRRQFDSFGAPGDKPVVHDAGHAGHDAAHQAVPASGHSEHKH